MSWCQNFVAYMLRRGTWQNDHVQKSIKRFSHCSINGFPISSMTPSKDLTPSKKWNLYCFMLFVMLMLVNVSVCSDSSLVTILATSGPATIQCTRVCHWCNSSSSRVFDNGIILLMTLINCYDWEFTACFINNKLSITGLSENCWVLFWKYSRCVQGWHTNYMTAQAAGTN